MKIIEKSILVIALLATKLQKVRNLSWNPHTVVTTGWFYSENMAFAMRKVFAMICHFSHKNNFPLPKMVKFS